MQNFKLFRPLENSRERDGEESEDFLCQTSRLIHFDTVERGGGHSMVWELRGRTEDVRPIWLTHQLVHKQTACTLDWHCDR